MTDLKTAWTQSRDRLKAAGIDSPVIDARLLLEAATGASRTDIVTDPYRALTAEQLATLEGYVERRCRREPVSKIIGRAGFWKILLRVTPDVLSPRPDTEAVLDVVLPQFGEHQAFDMLDLGTGSGALGLSIVSELSDRGVASTLVAVDESADAALRAAVEAQIEAESLPMFLSGRLYDDGVIDPRDTRTVLGMCLSAIANAPIEGTSKFGVFRM